jgi:hypothetical protein
MCEQRDRPKNINLGVNCYVIPYCYIINEIGEREHGTNKVNDMGHNVGSIKETKLLVRGVIICIGKGLSKLRISLVPINTG